MIQHESSIQNTESQGMSHLNYKHKEATIRLPFSQIGKVSRLVDFASEAKQTRTCMHNPTHRVIMTIHVASKKNLLRFTFHSTSGNCLLQLSCHQQLKDMSTVCKTLSLAILPHGYRAVIILSRKQNQHQPLNLKTTL